MKGWLGASGDTEASPKTWIYHPPLKHLSRRLAGAENTYNSCFCKAVVGMAGVQLQSQGGMQNGTARRPDCFSNKSHCHKLEPVAGAPPSTSLALDLQRKLQKCWEEASSLERFLLQLMLQYGVCLRVYSCWRLTPNIAAVRCSECQW